MLSKKPSNRPKRPGLWVHVVMQSGEEFNAWIKNDLLDLSAAFAGTQCAVVSNNEQQQRVVRLNSVKSFTVIGVIGAKVLCKKTLQQSSSVPRERARPRSSSTSSRSA